jgi:hypothetical protein
MEDNNQENVQNTNTQQVQQDPRLIHPEIIGELRKEKIGKPLMVVELFLLFGIVFAGLPFINSQLNDENSRLYQIIHGQQIPVIATTTKSVIDSEYIDGKNNTIISSDIKLKYKNIIMKNINITTEGVKCTMSSFNGVINLDNENYYFELASSSGTKIIAFKLVGTIDNVDREFELKSSGFQYNGSIGYQGKIVNMTDDDYPDITFPSYKPDSSNNNYASFICRKDNRLITYKFQNNFLINIVDEIEVNHSDYSDDEYTNMLDAARKKATNLGSAVATADETEEGFEFVANINLLGDYKVPSSVVDYDYYPKETRAQKIAYAQTSKGYDCQ